MNCGEIDGGDADAFGDEIIGWVVRMCPSLLCWGGVSSSPFDGTAALTVWQLNRTCIDFQTGDTHVFGEWPTELFSEVVGVSQIIQK
jgi:hypothetical protein